MWYDVAASALTPPLLGSPAGASGAGTVLDGSLERTLPCLGIGPAHVQ